MTALPQPPKTSQKVPRNSAPHRLPRSMFESFQVESQCRPDAIARNRSVQIPRQNCDAIHHTQELDANKLFAEDEWPLRDLNPDVLRHKILSLACLPIPPSGRFADLIETRRFVPVFTER